MAHVLLIHWDWSEVIDLAAELERRGINVITESDDGVRAVRMVVDNPPDAVAISLRKDFRHGRDVAIALRDHPQSRSTPVVFFDGDERAQRKLLKSIPDAAIVAWGDLSKALEPLVAGASE